MPRQGQLIALSEMVKFIQEHYRESICVDDIAKAAEVSRRECFRCFKELRGESPTVFLTQYRLCYRGHASWRLRASPSPP